MLMVLSLSACSKKSGKLFPAGPPMAESMQFQYAIYMLPVPARDPLTVLQQILSKEFKELKLVAEIPKQPKEMFVHARTQKNVHDEYPPPTAEHMKYYQQGLSAEQVKAVQSSQEAFILEFAHPKAKVWTGLRDANVVVEEIARATRGLIWDEETRQLFNPDTWHKERLQSWKSDPPGISTQMTIQVYQNGDYARAITMGMSKVGLPDVFVEESPWSAKNQVANLINAFSESMVETGTLARPAKYYLDLNAIKNFKVEDLKKNSTATACLTLRNGEWEEGDPKNRLLELTFDRYSGPDSHAKEDAMIASLFGAEDGITHVEHTDELLAASREAKTKLPELRKAFNAGLEPSEFIQLKAPFPTLDGGNEWMWVEVTSWKGDHIKGTLENDPFEAKYLHAGQVVEVKEEDIFDYIRQFADKHREGNTTGAILDKMEDKKTGATGQTKGPVQKVPNPCENS